MTLHASPTTIPRKPTVPDGVHHLSDPENNPTPRERTAGRSAPGSIIWGGAVLAGIAGYINVVMIASEQIPVTHVSGTLSRASFDVGEGNTVDLALVFPLIAAFMFGAVVSGLVIGRPTLRLGRPYGVAMLIEAALLAFAVLVIGNSPMAGAMLGAAAAGLQNAMASNYGGVIVRTTHVTGIVTDLGFLLGRWLRHRHVEPWQMLLLLALLAAFFAGGIGGVFAAKSVGTAALWLPCAVVGVGGLGLLLWRSLTPAGHEATLSVRAGNGNGPANGSGPTEP